MRVSKRVQYGLRALLDLALHQGPRPIQSGDVATRQQIPEPYLHQILLALRRAGLVRSFRGPHGGHRLARPPAGITLVEAVAALEGSPAQVDRSEKRREPLEAEIVREVWDQVAAASEEVLRSITLDDLCQQKLAREERIMYYI